MPAPTSDVEVHVECLPRQSLPAKAGPRSRPRISSFYPRYPRHLRLNVLCSDTVSRVIPPRARRGRNSSPQPSVNNSAAPPMKSSEKPLRSRHACRGRIAPGGSRSFAFHPTRINKSSPARPAASVPTSERTIAYEAPGIRLTHDGATMHHRKIKRMKNWKDLTH